MKKPTLTLSCALIGTLLTANTIQVPAPVDGRSTPMPIGRHLELLEDKEGILTLEGAMASSFSTSGDDVPNLGLTASVFWVRYVISNRTGTDEVLVEVSNPETESIDLYAYDGSRLLRSYSSGQMSPVGSRPLSDPNFLFPIKLAAGGECTVYMRFRSSKQLQIPIRLTTREQLLEARSAQAKLIGGYIGIMLVMAIYNLFIFLSARDKSYLIYVVYIALVSLTQLTFLGIGQHSFWPGAEWFAGKASIIFTIATAVAASEFMRAFIRTRETAPKLDRVIPWFYGLFAICLALYLGGQPMIGYGLAQLSAGLFAPFMFATAFVVWRRRSRQAGYFLIAWSVFLTGTMVFVLKDAGVLPYNALTIYTMPLGSAIEGVLLSFGLADRINVLRRDKERSQAEALAALQENERIISDQNAMLERKVTERTHELVEANDELKRTQVQLIEAEKMAGLGQLTAGIAHEINNPINFINSNIPPLRRNLQDMVEVLGDFRSMKENTGGSELKAVNEKCDKLGLDESIAELDGMIASIDEGARRTAEIVKGLRNFSRLDEDAVKKADINEGIRSTIGLLSPQVRGHATISTALAELPLAECHPGKLNQAVMNLLTNAAQAVRTRHGDGGDGVVSMRSWHENGNITIAVQDNGCGMSEAVKARIFEPFFTTKAVGDGTGLGLSITYSIVQKHNGSIAVESTPGHGSEFRITIPVIQQQEETVPAAQAGAMRA